MINTVWVPYRYLPAMVHPIMAYAGRLFSGEQIEFGPFMTEFVAERFGFSGAPLSRISTVMTALHLERRRTMLEEQLLAWPIEKLTPRRGEIERFHILAANAETALLESRSTVKIRMEEFEQWLLTAGFLRDIAALRLKELNAMNPDMTGRKALYERLRRTFLKYRDYAGTMAEEPKMGQIPRYWSGDNPLEFISKLINQK